MAQDVNFWDGSGTIARILYDEDEVDLSSKERTFVYDLQGTGFIPHWAIMMVRGNPRKILYLEWQDPANPEATKEGWLTYDADYEILEGFGQWHMRCPFWRKHKEKMSCSVCGYRFELQIGPFTEWRWSHSPILGAMAQEADRLQNNLPKAFEATAEFSAAAYNVLSGFLAANEDSQEEDEP